MRRLSGLPADNLKLDRRGRLLPTILRMVIFDPARFRIMLPLTGRINMPPACATCWSTACRCCATASTPGRRRPGGGWAGPTPTRRSRSLMIETANRISATRLSRSRFVFLQPGTERASHWPALPGAEADGDGDDQQQLSQQDIPQERYRTIGLPNCASPMTLRALRVKTHNWRR